MDPTQQDRMNRIMQTETAQAAPIIPTPPTVPEPPQTAPNPAIESVSSKKSSSTPLLLIIAGAIFFIVYGLFWAYYFKLIQF